MNCDGLSLEKFSDETVLKMQKNGIEELFPVQKAVYQLFVDGKELIVKSKTGSGKTLAFLLPLQELILGQERDSQSNKRAVQAVILEPTRELAIQVHE